MVGENILVLDNTCKVGARPKHCAGTTTEEGNTSEEKKNITFASSKKATGITINGIDLAETQKKRKDRENAKSKKTTLETKTTPGRKNKRKKTTPSIDQTGQILKYLVKRKNTEDNPCCEDNPIEVNKKTEPDEKLPHSEEGSEKTVRMNSQETVDMRKKTFTTHRHTNNIHQKIKKFEDWSTGIGCMIEGGMCSKHYKKAERVLKVRKMSVVGENGEVSWVRTELTSLVCPASDVSNKPVMSSDVCGGTPNKKQRINLEIHT